MKYLTLTDSQLETNLKSLLKRLKKQATISLSNLYEIPKKNKITKPTIRFTAQAYNKMMALVTNCDIEIAWHSTVIREEDTFVVTDTLCYPQIAQAVHVESCDEGYHKWRDELDDNTYNTLKMQGHSHVNMGVTPSGTDHNYYDILMEHITTYQIFIIMNKRGSMWIELRDIENNIHYDMNDMVIDMPSDNMNIWADEEIKKYVSKPVSKVVQGYWDPVARRYVTPSESNRTTNSKKLKELIKYEEEDYNRRLVASQYDWSGY